VHGATEEDEEEAGRGGQRQGQNGAPEGEVKVKLNW